MALEIRASDIRDFTTDMQDSGITHQETRTRDNSIQETRDKDGNMSIVLNSYQKYWIYEKPYGHDIIIWTDVGKLTIECKWPNRKRNNDGRVTNKK